MHASVLDFLRSHLSVTEVKGSRVIEVGSFDVNGSPRSVVLPLEPKEYIGVDSQAGNGVDRVVEAGELVGTFGAESFDVVICTEVLEHVRDWREVVAQLKRSVRSKGLLLITTRSPGFPYHPYPVDLWRYTLDDIRRIFSDMEILELVADPQVPGVFLKARKQIGFQETDTSSLNVHAMAPPADFAVLNRQQERTNIRIKMCIVTVPRANGYIHQTIRSLRETGFLDNGGNLPLRISVACPDATHVVEYVGKPNILVSAMAPGEINHDALNIRQKCSWGHVRAMRLMLSCADEWDVALIVEDDVAFARGWEKYLRRLLDEVRRRHGERWMVTLFRYTWGVAEAYAMGESLTDVNKDGRDFNGAPAMIYPRAVLAELCQHMYATCVETFQNLSDIVTGEFAFNRRIPILATVPCLVQHMGAITTGQSPPGMFFKANLFLDSVEHL